MIEVSSLSKEFKVIKKSPGVLGAFKALFTREYEIKRAVDNISFSIEQGEMVGYIGANGAGKSTTIKMLCGILTPSHGEITVNGLIPYKERQRNAQKIGAVFGQRTQLFWDIAVRESYELLKHIYSIPELEFQETLDQFIEVLDLEPLLGTPVRQLSLGQKMRCELAAAFLHRPSIVYLDEPTIGLDLSVKTKIRAFIREMNRERGTTIILTTHDMQDIEEICNRIIIIDKGVFIYDGSLQAIKERFGHKRIIHFEMSNESFQPFIIPSTLKDRVRILNGGDEVHGKVSLVFSNHEITGAEVISEIMASYQVRDLTIADSKIETIVQEIYEKGLVNEKILGNDEIPNSNRLGL